MVPSAYLRLLIVLLAILILRSHPAQHLTWCTLHVHDFLGSSDGKASAYNAGDLGSIPGSGRSPGEGNGNLLQYSCLENPMDRGAWWATVHGVAKSRTRLSDSTFHSTCELNKPGDNIHPWCTPFSILYQPVVPCPVLTVASCPAYRFLRMQVRRSGIPISLRSSSL